MSEASRAPRLLVLDAYAREGREALASVGATEAGTLYAKLLRHFSPEAEVQIATPADLDTPLPEADEIAAFDGVVWTGSSLTIHDASDARVLRQIDFARQVFDAGVPSFGSCWAAQIAVVAAGGRCAAHPRGREFGISRGLRLTEEGQGHPLFLGKAPRFDAFTSHADHVVALGSTARVLAANAWSPVQAVGVSQGASRFWALQYHPEYDCHEVASLCRLRKAELVEQGSFATPAEAERFIEGLEALHLDPTQREIADELSIGEDLLDPAQRAVEVRNWLRSLEVL